MHSKSPVLALVTNNEPPRPMPPSAENRRFMLAQHRKWLRTILSMSKTSQNWLRHLHLTDIATIYGHDDARAEISGFVAVLRSLAEGMNTRADELEALLAESKDSS